VQLQFLQHACNAKISVPNNGRHASKISLQKHTLIHGQQCVTSISYFQKHSVGTEKQLTPTTTGTHDPVPLLCNRNTHTHPFNSPFSRTTQVSRYQNGKTNLEISEARDSEWQWNLLGHMRICTSLQTDNHNSTPPLSFLQTGCPSCCPTNSIKALKATLQLKKHIWNKQQMPKINSWLNNNENGQFSKSPKTIYSYKWAPRY